MWEDPIVEEVHRVREQLAAKFNFDVEAIFDDLQRRQVALGSRLVKQKKRFDGTDGSEKAAATVPPHLDLAQTGTAN